MASAGTTNNNSNSNSNSNNPWEDAMMNLNNETEDDEPEEEEEFTIWMVRSWLYMFHAFDLMLGIAMIIWESIHFAHVIRRSEQYGAFLDWVGLLWIVLGTLLLVRGFYLVFTLCYRKKALDYRNDLQNAYAWKRHWRRAFCWSGRSSIFLGTLCLVGGVIVLIVASTLLRHHHSTREMRAAWITLVCVGVLEWIRFLCVDNYRQVEIDDEDDDRDDQAHYDHQYGVLDHQQRNGGRPWWWKNNQALEEPLLTNNNNNNNNRPAWTMGGRRARDYEIRDGLEGSFFSRFFSRKSSNSNPRDDGSADFASVQEEWASRSEEDPLWWTKDATANNNGGNS